MQLAPVPGCLRVEDGGGAWGDPTAARTGALDPGAVCAARGGPRQHVSARSRHRDHGDLTVVVAEIREQLAAHVASPERPAVRAAARLAGTPVTWRRARHRRPVDIGLGRPRRWSRRAVWERPRSEKTTTRLLRRAAPM